MGKEKIIIFDIETTPVTAYTWDLYPNGLSHDNIVVDWSIICAAYKNLGDKTTKALKINKVGDDYEVCKKLGEVLSEADIVIGHNIDKFDVPKLTARLAYHKLPPLPKLVTVDTRKKAKDGKFTSNRMDYLCKHLLGEGKMEVHYSLWLDVMKGSKQAVNKMVEYNKIDVIRNEELYLRLRPYMKSHPHVGVMNDGLKCDCPKCGSQEFQRRGTTVTAGGGKYQRLQCQSCGGWTQVSLKQLTSPNGKAYN